MRDKIISRPIIVIIACILIVAVLTVIGVAVGLNIRDTRMTEKYNREKSSLEFQKNQLFIERDRVKNEIYSKLGAHAFLTISLNSLEEIFVERMYEELSEYSVEEIENSVFTATFLLSPEQLPDMEGNITLDKFNWYLERGYKYALVYDGSTELREFLDNMTLLLFGKGIAFPTTICYYGNKEDSLLKEEDKPILEEYGIKVAASMREDGFMVEEEMYEGVFSPGILGWNTINVSSNTFNYALSKGGNFGFVFDDEWANSSIYKQNSYMDFNRSLYFSGFLRMLDRFLMNVKNEKLLVTDYETGAEMRREYLVQYEIIKPTLIEALENIDAQISDIERQLSAISDKYKR